MRLTGTNGTDAARSELEAEHAAERVPEDVLDGGDEALDDLGEIDEQVVDDLEEAGDEVREELTRRAPSAACRGGKREGCIPDAAELGAEDGEVAVNDVEELADDGHDELRNCMRMSNR